MVGVGWTTAGGGVCSDGLMPSPLPLRLKTLSDIRTSKVCTSSVTQYHFIEKSIYTIRDITIINFWSELSD